MFGLIYFIIALSVIVLVHEIGHLLMAKRYGVHCFEFSIGMGPKLVHLYTDKSGTKYNIRWIPIGGYVQMAGENNLETDSDINKGLSKGQMLDQKTSWQKFQILIAGSMMNFILGFLIFFSLNFFGGINSQNYQSNTVNVVEDYPAEQVGIESGDQIISINGNQTDSYDEISQELDKQDGKFEIEYQDSDSQLNISDIEKKQVSCDKDSIGITPSETNDKYNFIDSITKAFSSFLMIIGSIFLSIKMLFTQMAGVSDLMGPLGMAQGSSSIVDEGFRAMMLTISILSINIGLVNLMPIPALDGGRILFVVIEVIIRKQIPKKIEMYINSIGIFLLLLLFLTITVVDFNRILEDESISMEISESEVCYQANQENKINLKISLNDFDESYENVIIDISLENAKIISINNQEVEADTYQYETSVDQIISEKNDIVMQIIPKDDQEYLLIELKFINADRNKVESQEKYYLPIEQDKGD